MSLLTLTKITCDCFSPSSPLTLRSVSLTFTLCFHTNALIQLTAPPFFLLPLLSLSSFSVSSSISPPTLSSYFSQNFVFIKTIGVSHPPFGLHLCQLLVSMATEDHQRARKSDPNMTQTTCTCMHRLQSAHQPDTHGQCDETNPQNQNKNHSVTTEQDSPYGHSAALSVLSADPHLGPDPLTHSHRSEHEPTAAV